MNEIAEKIKINNELGKNIEDIISSIEIPNDNQKAMLFTAFLQDSISHFYAINILIDKKLYNSAFALVRVFFDTLVRGQYTVYIFDDTVVDKMYLNQRDWNFPKTKNMCKALDDFFEANIFDKIRTNSYGMMCDYAHVGQNQIARHFNEEKCAIEPNFDSNLIIDTLEGNYALMELFAKNFIEFMKQHRILTQEVSL